MGKLSHKLSHAHINKLAPIENSRENSFFAQLFNLHESCSLPTNSGYGENRESSIIPAMNLKKSDMTIQTGVYINILSPNILLMAKKLTSSFSSKGFSSAFQHYLSFSDFWQAFHTGANELV